MYEPENLDDTYAELREQAAARLGTRTPRCCEPGCAETDPLALTGAHPNEVCYEHGRIARGLPWVEQQHTAGTGNAPEAVPIPGNDHRVIDAAKVGWDRATLRGEAGPLRAAAGALRGWLETMYVIMTRSVGWVPAFLETLDAALVALLGPRWWQTFGWVWP